MSFFKCFIIALIATLALTYTFGTGVAHLVPLEFGLSEYFVQRFELISMSALLGLAILFAIGILLCCIFGTVVFFVAGVLGALLLLGASFLSPLLIFFVIIWLCLSQSQVLQN
ncbi:hypothetical protein [Thalassotalea aquiviva]|uniref:hypothetical protein n=1 Tax=Thalassotalea aquiviva TaxID=3242415 RepID=UPI00352A5086